jgi:rhodanese-related sulfurtransferase/transcriptional regulator with XRE-family HTH domain
MIRTIGPRDVEALTAAGDVDIVDVREPGEWATGHIPGARLLPLGQLRGDPDGAGAGQGLGNGVGKKVLFVCASGGRSLTAAKLAEQRGVPEVYSLDGGTAGWARAGLPIVHPAPEAAGPAKSTEASGTSPGSSAVAGPVAGAGERDGDPELDAVVGKNVHDLRTQRGLTLDVLAGQSGVSRQTLGQIEMGRTVPTVATLWKIARAFDVPFSLLLARPIDRSTRLLRQGKAKRLVSADGRFSSRALFLPDDRGKVEFYELWLAGHGREDAEPHAAGTREHLMVTSGKLVLDVGAETFELVRGDAIVFTADVRHSYVNPASEECWMNLVMTYATA